MSKVNKIILSYSPIGIFSLNKGKLSTEWEALTESEKPISRESLGKIFASKLHRSHDSNRSVVAEVEIISQDIDGVIKVRLMESSRLER